MQKILFVLIFLVGCSSFNKKDKETAELHLQIGTSYLQNGNYPQALNELMQAEKLDHENKYIQNNLGLAYYVRGRYETAEKHFRQALELDENFSDARNNLGKALIEQNQNKEALKELNKVANDLTYIYPERPLINIGIAKFQLKDYLGARENFIKVLNIQRTNCLAHSYYGRTLYETREYRKAAAAFDRAVGFCQKELYDEPQYYSALSYYQMSQFEKAQVRCLDAIKLYPNGKYTDKSKTLLTQIQKHL